MTTKQEKRAQQRKEEDRYDENECRTCMIDVADIEPNENKTRQSMDDVEIISLADSIRKNGLLQPIIVRTLKTNEYGEPKYGIIAGERRYKAVKMLAKRFIPCVIVDINEEETTRMSMIENMMRSELSMFEYADALSNLINIYNVTQEELADKMSISQSNIANKLRLLKLTDKEKKLIIENNLNERHARAILRIKDYKTRSAVLNQIIASGMNVKQTEECVESVINSSDYDDAINIIEKLYGTAKSDVDRIRLKGEEATVCRYETKDEVRIIFRYVKR